MTTDLSGIDSRKRRNTAQKQIILDTLKKLGSHVSATAVYQQLQLTHPNIGRATVFRVLSDMAADGILRGASMMRQFMISTFTDLILRVALAICLSARFGYVGIWCSWPIGWAIGTALSVWFYKKGPWKGEVKAVWGSGKGEV